MASRAGRWGRTLILPSFWLFISLAMVRSHFVEPYDPTLAGTAAYGNNHAGALLDIWPLTLVELVVLLTILRPWTYRRSWRRASLALVLAIPWTFVSVLLTLHAGGIVALHGLWAFTVAVGLVVATVWSGAASWFARNEPVVPQARVHQS